MKLSITDLNVELNNTLVLKDVSLGIEEGEFVSLVGPSGCGKSTLFKAVAGIIPAKSGEIVLDGERLNDIPAYRRGIVIVFQDMRLFPNMTVSENIAYPLRIKGLKQKERMAKSEELLADVQLEGLGDRRVHQLSGGQQQRVALARALAAEPRVMLLDEPFSALDENLRDDMRQLIKKLHNEFHMTTMMVTHDINEAKLMSDRIIKFPL